MSEFRKIKCPHCHSENFEHDGYETLTVREFESHFKCCDCDGTFCVRGSVQEIQREFQNALASRDRDDRIKTNRDICRIMSGSIGTIVEDQTIDGHGMVLVDFDFGRRGFPMFASEFDVIWRNQ